MFWKKKLIPLIIKKKESKTLEQVANETKVGDTYYFRIEMGLKRIEEVVLYAKTPIGYNTVTFELPLRCTAIQRISTKCSGNRKFWEEEMLRALNLHWSKYAVS